MFFDPKTRVSRFGGGGDFDPVQGSRLERGNPGCGFLRLWGFGLRNSTCPDPSRAGPLASPENLKSFEAQQRYFSHCAIRAAIVTRKQPYGPPPQTPKNSKHKKVTRKSLSPGPRKSLLSHFFASLNFRGSGGSVGLLLGRVVQ